MSASAPNRPPEVLVAQVATEQDLGALTWHQLEPAATEEMTSGGLPASLSGLKVAKREVKSASKTVWEMIEVENEVEIGSSVDQCHMLHTSYQLAAPYELS